MSNQPGEFIWYELMTADPAAARRFYNQVMGWQMQSELANGSDSGFEYRMIMNGPMPVGGVFTIAPAMAKRGAKPCWLSYIGVSDVDASVRGIVAAGGACLLPAQDIPGVGRLAMVADPGGAPFYVMRGSSQQRSESFSMGKLGHAGWNELHASNPAKACDFYEQQFGWAKSTAMDMGPMGQYQLMKLNGQDFGAVMANTAMPYPMWLTYFHVDSAEQAAKRIVAAGGKVLDGPMQVPGDDWIVTGLDPEGVVFAVVGKK